MPLLTRLGRLHRLRQVAMSLMAAETVSVMLEKTINKNALPDWVDIAIGLVGLSALAILLIVEAGASALSTTLVADAASLATIRLHDEEDRRTGQRRRERIENALEGADYPSMVFQPIVDLNTLRTVGFEALSRFGPGDTPDVWFAEAAAVGLGLDLELKAIRRALQ